MHNLKIYNSMQKKKVVFEPIDIKNIRVYACGPTVYDYAHIGNARMAVVFDSLIRLLRYLYPILGLKRSPEVLRGEQKYPLKDAFY